MATFTIQIEDSFIEKAFLSFINALGIKYKKKEDIKTDEDANNRIIPAEEEGNASLLFGKWADIEIDAKELRKTSWRRNSI